MSGKKNNQKWILLLILFLVVGIGATTMIYMDRIREFLPNDDGAISLIDEGADIPGGSDDKSGAGDSTGSQAGTEDGVRDGAASEEDGAGATGTGTTQKAVPIIKPGSETSDDDVVWHQETEAEIFRTSYANDQGEVTVQSSNGDKVIAPGTTNSYTFKLKNIGNVALDYEVNLDMFTNMEDQNIPLECRVNRYDGSWVFGGPDEWVSIYDLQGVTDNYTVGAGRYTTYTLDWRWPFEANADEVDTYLGNLVVQQDVVFTLLIETEAEISKDAQVEYGILPDTGDSSHTLLYVFMMGGAILMILILLWYREREDEEADYE